MFEVVAVFGCLRSMEGVRRCVEGTVLFVGICVIIVKGAVTVERWLFRWELRFVHAVLYVREGGVARCLPLEDVAQMILTKVVCCHCWAETSKLN